MATTPEGKVKAVIKAALAARGWLFLMPATHGYGASGWADFVLCVKDHAGVGRFIAIEAKALAPEARPLQVLSLNAVAAAGGLAVVVGSAGARSVRPGATHDDPSLLVKTKALTDAIFVMLLEIDDYLAGN